MPSSRDLSSGHTNAKVPRTFNRPSTSLTDHSTNVSLALLDSLGTFNHSPAQGERLHEARTSYRRLPLLITHPICLRSGSTQNGPERTDPAFDAQIVDRGPRRDDRTTCHSRS